MGPGKALLTGFDQGKFGGLERSVAHPAGLSIPDQTSKN